MKENDKRSRRFIFILGCVFAVGAFLRLYMLSSQILLDDEWLGLNAVIGKSYFEVLTKFNPLDNTSVPLNIYNLALFHSFGWSELTVRLPAILAGLLSLIALPLLVKNVFNDRVALIFACLLAIAPFLIFYSRFARAYSFVTLCCFSALLLSHQWLTTGKVRYAIGFVVVGAFAICAHLLSLVAVFMPLVTALGVRLADRFNAASSLRQQIIVPMRALFTVAFILTALIVPLCWPVLLESAKLPWGRGHMTLGAVWHAATLLSGTVNAPLNALFYLFFLAGFILLLQQNPLLGWTCLSVISAYLLVLLASRPTGLATGLVLLRYMIILEPVALTLLALAMDDLITCAELMPGRHRSLPILGVSFFLGCLWAAGPLPALYIPPNNFTNHAAFQYSYHHSTWEHSEADTVFPAFQVTQDRIPPFYHWLGGQSNCAAIIEYPFDTCDYNDLFYYYQHFHHQRVLAGYCLKASMLGYRVSRSPEQAAAPIRTGKLCADDILSRVADPTKIAFRNMIDVLNEAALWKSGADFLILHKYFMVLQIMPGGGDGTFLFGSIPVIYRSVDLLKSRFKATLGTPVYEDAEIVCFQIKRVKPQGQ
jgi:hypothetical protein